MILYCGQVELLLRVHHINLVSLVGYCDEQDHFALIYEYMSNGDLHQHLSGEHIYNSKASFIDYQMKIIKEWLNMTF